jgi:hypothetical protein
LEHEALQTYEDWTDLHWIKLRGVERYWKIQVELVFALKKDTTSSLMAGSEVKFEISEGIHVLDVEGVSPGEP